MVDGAVQVHACHGWHTWGRMVSVVDLPQDKQNQSSGSTTIQRSLLVKSVQLVLNGRKNRIQLSQLEDNSELVVAVEVVDRRARSVRVVRDVVVEGREVV